jgi:hypothetical protein
MSRIKFDERRINVKRDETRPDTYHVTFIIGLGQMRGWNNPTPSTPSIPEAIVEIVGDEPDLSWRVPPSDDESILDAYAKKAKELALEAHQRLTDQE